MTDWQLQQWLIIGGFVVVAWLGAKLAAYLRDRRKAREDEIRRLVREEMSKKD